MTSDTRITNAGTTARFLVSSNAHGVWDLDELYDLDRRPHRVKNLITDEALAPVAEQLRSRHAGPDGTQFE
jgi:hypothetical protein